MCTAATPAHLPTDPRAPLHRHLLEGEIPSPMNLPPGCACAGRCPVALARCSEATVGLTIHDGSGRSVACLRVADGGNRLNTNQEVTR